MEKVQNNLLNNWEFSQFGEQKIKKSFVFLTTAMAKKKIPEE